MQLLNSLYKLCAIMVLTGSLVGGWVWMQYKGFLRQPMLSSNAPAQVVEFKSGESIRQFAKHLEAREVLSSARYFEWLARWRGVSKHLRAGEYAIMPGMNPTQFLKQLQKGEVVQHSITFIEGWTFHELLSSLAADPYIKHDLKSVPPEQQMARLGFKLASPEGWFFPDTYHFPKGTSDVVILQQAHQRMQTKLAALWAGRSLKTPYKDPYQALILASLIERETSLAHERPLVAGVLVRRLKRRMPLQVDASVIYGLGPYFTPPLSKADLRKRTPYNTYVHRGLPPTAIAMPSEASVQAALHPAQGSALYFVARGDGSHVFSDTLREHNRAVKAYIKHQRYQEKHGPSAMVRTG